MRNIYPSVTNVITFNFNGPGGLSPGVPVGTYHAKKKKKKKDTLMTVTSVPELGYNPVVEFGIELRGKLLTRF